MSRGTRPRVRILLIAAALLVPGWSAAVDPPVEDPSGPEAVTEPAESAEPISPARIISATQKAPPYPPAALAARFTGSVKVSVKVLPDGTVGDVKVLDCSHRNIGFEEAAMGAVKKWRFQPAMQAGKAVEYTTTYRLNFRNSGEGAGFNPFVSSGAAEDIPTTTANTTPKKSTPTRTKPQ